MLYDLDLGAMALLFSFTALIVRLSKYYVISFAVVIFCSLYNSGGCSPKSGLQKSTVRFAKVFIEDLSKVYKMRFICEIE